MAGKTSTGCRTCVKRRVKCDETRPVCLRCRKANKECPGYVDNGIQITVYVPTSDKTVPQNKSRLEEGDHAEASSSAQVIREPSNSSTISKGSADIPQDLSLSGFTNNLYCSFLVNTYWASDDSTPDFGNINRQWFTQCLNKEEDHPTSSLALQALAMAFFGRKHRQDQIVLRSIALYGRALRALSQDLQTPDKLASFDTLAAVTTLSLFEYCAQTTQTAYIRHTSALSHIFKFRGPNSFENYPEKGILQTQRVFIIIQAAAARKRTFLSDPEWLAIHEREFADPNLSRSIFDIPVGQLLNIFAVIPGVAEDVEIIHCQRVLQSLGRGVVDTRLLESATASVMSLTGALERWFQDHGPLLEMSRWEASAPMRITRDSEGPLFDTILWYRSLEAASVWTLYTTIKLISHKNCYILQNPSFSLKPIFRSVPYLSAQYFASFSFEDHDASVVPLAHTILRSIEYQLQPIHVNAGAFNVLFPARMAYTTLKRGRRERVWLKRLMERIADEGGLEMARNILAEDILEVAQWEARKSKNVTD